MKKKSWWLSMLFVLPGLAAADVVTDWSLLATQAVVTKGGRAGALEFAMVNAAMFDAVNGIAGRYAPYEIVPKSPRNGASQDAAAAAAAHRVLAGLFPEQAGTLDAAYAASLAKLPNDAAVAKGIAIGEEVGNAMLELRAVDGRASPAPIHVFGTGAGVYQATTPYPPTGQPINTWMSGVTPFVIPSAAKFRPYGPPGLTSARFLRDVEEVRQYGSLTSTLRTETQSENARFHTENPNQFWGRNLSNVVASRDLGTLKSARLMALLSFAQADAALACFDAKYAYTFWRPVTAIQQTDASWLPYQNTPPHPEYPAAHGCIAGAVAEILEQELDGRGKILFNSTVTGAVHTYRCPEDLVDEIVDARVHGGMHFRNSVRHGAALGRAVASYIGKHALLPNKKR